MPPAIDGEQTFSNPIAPTHLATNYEDDEDDSNLVTSANLTNADFRKMLMTPAPKAAKPKPQVSVSHTDREKQKEREKRLREKKKKKSEYLEYKKANEARQKELSEKYRDRASERREEQKTMSTTGLPTNQYAPAGTVGTTADRRKQAIQESKFLGGDIDHTHLVKGLDFALLQKMREEMAKGEQLEQIKSQKIERSMHDDKSSEEPMNFKTKLGQSVYRVLFLHKHPERNELFSQNRMAYQVEMDDEYAESDVPTTLIRSKAEVKGNIEKRTLTNNDIVINKLTQILAYLRQGNRYGKQKTKKKDKRKFEIKPNPVPTTLPEDDIFGGVGEYVPPSGDDRVSVKRADKPKSYFDEVKEKSKMDDQQKIDADKKKRKELQSKMRLEAQAASDSYMECYPGGMAEAGGGYDSDEEADYSKMDMGNKKGPLTRWDFEDEEKYNRYMENREALPKAAFQFGIKMSDGRKTRKHKALDDKQKLNRDMQRINQIIQKRKSAASGDGVPEKMARY